MSDLWFCRYVQADTEAADIQEALEKKKKRTFRKYTYRGVDLDQLLDMSKWVLNQLPAKLAVSPWIQFPAKTFWFTFRL